MAEKEVFQVQVDYFILQLKLAGGGDHILHVALSKNDTLKKRMHSSRMRTARMLPYWDFLPDRDPPEQRPPLDRDPPGQRPPGQRLPGQRPPMWTDRHL